MIDLAMMDIQKKVREISKNAADLGDKIERQSKRIEELKGELDAPTDEKLAEAHAKNKELMQELNRVRSNSLYVFTEEEKEMKSNLYHRHRDSRCKSRQLHYEVVGTGIGSICFLGCKLCGFHEEIGNTIG